MEPEARYTYIGAALLALVFGALLGYVWLARTGSERDFRFYTIYFERQSLAGLQVGGDVNIRGIKVGRVEGYEISPDNINRVKVLVRVARNTPVSDNTVAVVSRSFVTGIATVSLVTPGTPGPPLDSPPKGEPYAVIPEGESDIEQLTGGVNRLAASAAATMDAVQSLLSPENRAAFSRTLANLNDVSAALNQRVARIDDVVEAINGVARDFRTASRDITAAVDRVASGVYPASVQAEQTLRDVSRAMKALERDTTRLAARADELADTGALEIRTTAAELRATAEALARAAERLQDPRAAILGPNPAQLGPGEKLR